MSTSQAQQMYQSAVRTWAEGGTIVGLEDVLKAAGRSLKDFGRDTNECKRKIEAGKLTKRTIRAVPPRGAM